MNSKTPIMILQEHMMKRGKPPPTYAHLDSQGNSFFKCSVQADGINELGTGRSKKDAKQNAAMKALEKLQDSGEYFPAPDVNLKRDPCKDVENQHLNVSKLKDLCSEYQLPTPEYDLLSETGPPHNKLFTIKYTIGSIERTATASTKKLAKQMAAGLVLQYFTENVPERINEITENPDTIVRLNDMAQKKYGEINKDIPWRPNLGQIIANYHVEFSKSLDKNTYDEITKMLKNKDAHPSSILFVEELFEKMGLEYEWSSQIGEKDTYVCSFCARKANPPIFILTVGSNAFDAKNKCSEEVIDYVRLML